MFENHSLEYIFTGHLHINLETQFKNTKIIVTSAVEVPLGNDPSGYRIIDFKRSIEGAEGTVFSIEYDPNRSARIALIKSNDGRKFYMIAPEGLKVGEKIMSSEKF